MTSTDSKNAEISHSVVENYIVLRMQPISCLSENAEINLICPLSIHRMGIIAESSCPEQLRLRVNYKLPLRSNRDTYCPGMSNALCKLCVIICENVCNSLVIVILGHVSLGSP